jgi:hypothetical protein
MPISVTVGMVPNAWLQRQVEVILEHVAQFSGHLEPQGIDPDIGGFAVVQPWLHLRREHIALVQDILLRMLRLLKRAGKMLRQL